LPTGANFRREGAAPENQESGRPGGYCSRPRPQDDCRCCQSRPTGTFSPRADQSSTLANEAGDEIDLDDTPAVWSQIEKFDLDVPFWRMVKTAFGYEEENPTLKMLLLRLDADRLRRIS